MNYVIKGNLYGLLCEDCTESISDVDILLYLPAQKDNVLAATVANAKETFRLVNKEEAAARKDLLVATAKTDAKGNFELSVSEKYGNTAFDIDFYCGTVPRFPPKGPKKDPVQFHITTFYPQWRTDRLQENQFFQWQYVISSKWWCFIRGFFFDTWTICGRLTDCKTGVAIPDVVVKAMDADFFTDDILGQATTDSTGHFRIEYSSIDFKKTFLSPLLNIETDPTFLSFQSGPDVYFNLEYKGSKVTFETAANRRNNVEYCLCVDLCLPDWKFEDSSIPATFNHIGNYDIFTQIDSTNGKGIKTGASGIYAFYEAITFGGALRKTIGGVAMEYKFEFQEVANPSVTPVAANWQNVTKAMMGNLAIGAWRVWNAVESRYVDEPGYINAKAGKRDIPVVTDWVQVPQDSNFDVNRGYNSPILRLNTTAPQIYPTRNLDVNGMTFGAETATLAAAPHVRNRYFYFRMKERQVGSGSTGTVAGTSRAVAVFNVLYHNVPKNGSWSPKKVNDQRAVVSLDIQEVVAGAGGCQKITTALNVKYNVRNENWGSAELLGIGPATLSFPSIPAAAMPLPEIYGSVQPTIPTNVNTLPACAYIIKLSAVINLTDGFNELPALYDEIAFCKV